MLNGDQLDAARVAVWLMARHADSAGAWIEAQPAALAKACGLDQRAARAAIARLVARGFVALERRAGAFWLQPTAAGRGPLGAYVLGYAAMRLTDG